MIQKVTITNFKDETLELELTKPELTGLAITKINGLGPPKSNINIKEMATMDGGYYTSSRMESRNITMTLLFMICKTCPTIEHCRNLVYKFFPIKKPLTFRITTDLHDAEIKGYVESNDPDIFSQQETAEISIVCPNPYFYEVGASADAFAGAQSLFQFPFSNEYGESISLQSQVLDNGETLRFYELGNENSKWTIGLNNSTLTINGPSEDLEDALSQNALSVRPEGNTQDIYSLSKTGNASGYGFELSYVNYGGYVFWDRGSLPKIGNWKKTNYFKGKYYIFSDTEYYLVSSNAYDWEIKRLPIDGDFSLIADNENVMVALRCNSTDILYTEDGETWNQTNAPLSGRWYAMTWGADRFIAIVRDSRTAIYSTDGIEWRTNLLPSQHLWQDICWGNNEFVAIISNSRIIARSNDGIVWRETTTLTDAKDWIKIVYNKVLKKYFVIGNKSTIINISDENNSNVFNSVELDGIHSFNDVVTAEDKIIATADGESSAWFTDTGYLWYESTFPTNNLPWKSLAYGNGRVIALSTDTLTYAVYDMMKAPRNIEFGRIYEDTTAALYYSGNIDTGLIIRVHANGNAEGITIFSVLTNEKMYLDTEKIRQITNKQFDTGDEIVINTTLGSRSVKLYRDGQYTDVISCIGRKTDWMMLTPGRNVFAFRAAKGEGNIYLTFEYEIAYGGV